MVWPQQLTTLLFDAGETLVYLDSSAVCSILKEEGHNCVPEAIDNAKSAARSDYEQRVKSGASHEEGWFSFMVTLLEHAGIASAVAPQMVGRLRQEHDQFNLWRKVPDGLLEQLQELKPRLQLGIVSNSEGGLVALLQRIGLASMFDLIVDSAHEGVRKPDPEIFRRALTRLNAIPQTSIYVGDIPDVDVAGAQAAGISAALLDPAHQYPQAPLRFNGILDFLHDLRNRYQI